MVQNTNKCKKCYENGSKGINWVFIYLSVMLGLIIIFLVFYVTYANSEIREFGGYNMTIGNYNTISKFAENYGMVMICDLENKNLTPPCKTWINPELTEELKLTQLKGGYSN